MPNHTIWHEKPFNITITNMLVHLEGQNWTSASTPLHPSFVEKPQFLRSFLARRPSFVRRRANKQWPYRRTSAPHPYPSLPLDEFLQLILVVLAKLVTKGLYQIGQLALGTACFAVEDGHLAPKFYLMRSRCWNLKTPTWAPSREDSIGTSGKGIVFEARERSIWMHSVPFPRVGILGTVLLLISYFIVFLLFRRKKKRKF